MQDDSILDEQVLLSNDEDSRNDHLLKVDSRQDWWRPLPEEERPSTPKPAWTIPSSHKSDVENNWASTLATTYEPPTENSLLAKTRDMTTFLKCKGSCHALSISKMNVASYPDFGLELLVHEQMWINNVCTYDVSAKYGISHWWFTRQKFYIDRHDSPSHQKDVRTHMRILSVIKIKAYSRYKYDNLSEIVLRRAYHQEHIIAEKDFKNMYLSDFEDLNLLLLVKEFKIKRLNPGMDTRFWTEKDVTRSKEFITAIERRPKTRRIYRNLECFVGGRVRDINYRLL
ncbi:hypothetical protein Tco_1337207 [Tanacetum coccineum]